MGRNRLQRGDFPGLRVCNIPSIKIIQPFYRVFLHRIWFICTQLEWLVVVQSQDWIDSVVDRLAGNEECSEILELRAWTRHNAASDRGKYLSWCKILVVHRLMILLYYLKNLILNFKQHITKRKNSKNNSTGNWKIHYWKKLKKIWLKIFGVDLCHKTWRPWRVVNTLGAVIAFNIVQGHKWHVWYLRWRRTRTFPLGGF